MGGGHCRPPGHGPWLLEGPRFGPVRDRFLTGICVIWTHLEGPKPTLCPVVLRVRAPARVRARAETNRLALLDLTRIQRELTRIASQLSLETPWDLLPGGEWGGAL